MAIHHKRKQQKLQKIKSGDIELLKYRQLEETEALNPTTDTVESVNLPLCHKRNEQKQKKPKSGEIELLKFRQLEETEALNPPATFLTGKTKSVNFPFAHFQIIRIRNLKHYKVELPTLEHFHEETNEEFLNSPVQSNEPQEIKSQNPFLTSIIEKLRIFKRKHSRSIANKSPTTASDGFKCEDLYAYEKSRALNPLVTLINQNYQQPSDTTKDIGIQVNINDIHLPLEATLDSVQVHGHEEIHVYEEIQPLNPPLEAKPDTVQVDIHSHEEIHVYEEIPDTVQVDIHSHEKINVHQEIQPLYPTLEPKQGPML
jgi:hypothetical protein